MTTLIVTARFGRVHVVELTCCGSRLQDKGRTILTMDDLSASLAERGVKYVVSSHS